jgi:hypothetical protein
VAVEAAVDEVAVEAAVEVAEAAADVTIVPTGPIVKADVASAAVVVVGLTKVATSPRTSRVGSRQE